LWLAILRLANFAAFLPHFARTVLREMRKSSSRKKGLLQVCKISHWVYLDDIYNFSNGC